MIKDIVQYFNSLIEKINKVTLHSTNLQNKFIDLTRDIFTYNNLEDNFEVLKILIFSDVLINVFSKALC